jgi:hypothetical protein
MTYLGISQAAADPMLRARVTGCIAEQDSSGEHPNAVCDRIIWQCCAEPGWGAAWASAVETQKALPPEQRTDIGSDPSVIPDTWILTAVQKHLALLGAEQRPT